MADEIMGKTHRGRAKLHFVGGEYLTINEASSKYNIKRTTLNARMKNNSLSLHESIFEYNSKRPVLKKGQTFGYLTVIEKGPRKKGSGTNAAYICKCGCGNVVNVLGTVLKEGGKTSCNCVGCKYGRDFHGKSGKDIYHTWSGMIQRCHNKNSPSYKYYGLVGIEVSKEFRESFYAFYQHVGERPSEKHSIDRIDVTKGYERGNLRWATRKQQMSNTRDVTTLTLEVQRLQGILEHHGIKYDK